MCEFIHVIFVSLCVCVDRMAVCVFEPEAAVNANRVWKWVLVSKLKCDLFVLTVSIKSDDVFSQTFHDMVSRCLYIHS